MARPKRIEGEKSARERMENAFWDMLADMPYHEMTAKELRARAKVSHNTFYYHFENMDDLAHKAFARMAVAEVPLALMSAVQGGGATVEGLAKRIPDFEQRLARMRLLAKSGSPLLLELMKGAMVSAWLAAANLSENDLTADDRIDLDFVFGGLIALFGNDASENPQVLAAFSQRELGQGVFRTMKKLTSRGHCANAATNSASS